MSHKFSHPRIKNWPTQFNSFIAASKRNTNLQLDWVNNLCASWAGDMVEAITSVNPYAEFRGVNSPVKASKAICNAGYRNLEQLMYDRFHTIPKSLAQRGDLCIVRATPQAIFDIEIIPVAICIVDPPHFWSLGEEGLCRGLLTEQAVKACFIIGDVSTRRGIGREST